ncbi:signal peptidase I [Pedobacter mendelii]|uniref:signal peptidase I n=1 Tax=Pedobacter mendelii TaxID=1908240 RepID=UPI003609D60B
MVVNKKIKRTIILIFLSLSTLLAIRTCFLDVFNIPSSSMNAKLFADDKVIINKMHYSGLVSKFLKRLNVKANLKPKDIVVFKIDSSEKSFYIKRCIALQGQSIEILNNEVKVNGRMLNEDPNVILKFKIFYKSYNRLEQFFNEADIDYFNASMVRNSNYLIINLNFGKYKLLKESAVTDSIKIEGSGSERASSKLKSDYSNLEFITLPYKGMTIPLNEKNHRLYSFLIKKYEGLKITRNNDEFRLGNKKISVYTFKKDYIFVLGDNRNNSEDSRHYGPIPVSNLIGVYLFKFGR